MSGRTRSGSTMVAVLGAAVVTAAVAGCGGSASSAPTTTPDPSEYELLAVAQQTLPGYRKCYFDSWPCVRVDEVIDFVAPPARKSSSSAISACANVWVSRTNGAFGSPGQPPKTPAQTSATGQVKRQQVCGFFNTATATGMRFDVIDSSPDMFVQARALGEKLCAPVPRCENATIDNYAADHSSPEGVR